MAWDQAKVDQWYQQALQAGAKKEQLDQIVQQKQADYIVKQGVPAQEIPANVNQLRGLTQQVAAGTYKTALSESEKKEKEKKKDTEIAIDLLESIYLGGEEEKPLSFGKEAIGGRLPGVGKELQRILAPGTFPESTRLNTYKRTLESIRPQLAKAAGDAGNIALMEQIMAGKGLPDEQSTSPEAIGLFKTMRGKFGLEPSERLSEFEKRQKKEPTIAGREAGLGNLLLGIGKSIAQPFKTTGETVGLTGQLGLIKALQVAGQPQLAGRLATGGFQETARKYSEQPQQAVAEQIGASAELASPKLLKLISPIISPIAGKAMGRITGAFKAKPPALSVSSLTEGLQTAEKAKTARTTVISMAQEAGKKVEGSRITGAIKEWAIRAKRANPTAIKKIDDFVTGAVKRFKGKNLNPQTAKNLWDDADKGFTAAGTKGSALEASYHRTIRDVLRKEIDKVAPGFEKTTKAIKKGLDLEEILKTVRVGAQRKEIREGLKEIPSPVTEFLKGTGKKVAGGVATGAGFYAIAKLLGLNIPGAFYESQ